MKGFGRNKVGFQSVLGLQRIVFLFFFCGLFLCCKPKKAMVGSDRWDVEQLKLKSESHSDTAKWDLKLYKQDIATFEKYAEALSIYPLNKTPFPVAEYDYAVASTPITVKVKNYLFKGVRIGEYENPESEVVKDALTLLVLTNDANAEESTLVESRNFPYLTAQGFFKTADNKFDWVFSKSPDGFSTLLFNMKLFDLRFGQTIVIVPQKDKSFVYCQINDSPENYKNQEEFNLSISENSKIRDLLSRKNTIGN
ncbi:hypothetical protein FLJC2902T_01910 [Flavobacterium limnosediminis JC2902]|uniref:Uncharacterized protein n=1 Tax=Flavobacterium limnosediminis JC2902 TaxID=1341181 RepID=V6SU69_9FLAO|nr:hypothetical protein [Flavobacterium limnosediminis]ESU29717.1 hypothetical protein FLJC2902T_01910 [Flavobacterium limnosediminis JC2902]